MSSRMREALERERRANAALLAVMRPVDQYLPVLCSSAEDGVQVTVDRIIRRKGGLWERIKEALR